LPTTWTAVLVLTLEKIGCEIALYALGDGRAVFTAETRVCKGQEGEWIVASS